MAFTVDLFFVCFVYMMGGEIGDRILNEGDCKLGGGLYISAKWKIDGFQQKIIFVLTSIN